MHLITYYVRSLVTFFDGLQVEACIEQAIVSLLSMNTRRHPRSRVKHQQFTAPDLATIARRLDRIENSYVTETRKRSTNMDDSGMYP